VNRAPIELRSATISDVRFPERVVELLAVPYNQWADVEYQGRLIHESFAPGAFGNIQNRTDRIAVLGEHDPSRVLGRVKRLAPDDPAGLRSELLIRRGDAGDQVLDDAADGMLDGSVGFGALPEHTAWDGNNRRRITKAFLDHIALVFNPAYKGAKVLAVRSAPQPTAVAPGERTATPNLDAILLSRLESHYSLSQ
jgi:HK97 family phage prohead protease